MAKIVPLIIANDAEAGILRQHGLSHLTESVILNDRRIYNPAFLLSTHHSFSPLHISAKDRIEYDHLYSCEDEDVSLFAILAASKIANEKYPGTPILMLKATMLRSEQKDHSRDVIASIADAKVGHVITLSSINHLEVDAIFTYEGLNNTIARMEGDRLDVMPYWRDYDQALASRHGLIPEGPAMLRHTNAHDAIEFKLRTKKITYASKKPEFYSPWKTRDEISAFSAK